MDHLLDKFLEEVEELISELEEVTLRLEQHSSDRDIIEHVFRIMHTIKGASGMYGFDYIYQYTHNLESVYDFVRKGKITVDESILQITLQSVDHLKDLLEEKEKLSKKTQETHKQLNEQVAKIVGTNENANVQIASTETNQQKSICTFFIRFKPGQDIFKTGNDPVYLLEELATLGKIQIFIRQDQLNEISDFQANKCYVYWDIFISTDQDDSSLKDVFMFVEENSEISIEKISSRELLSEPIFEGVLKSVIKNDSHVDLHQLLELTKEIEYIIDGALETNQSNGRSPDGRKQLSSIRVPGIKLDQLMNLVSELVTVQARLSTIASEFKSGELNSVSEEITKLSSRLRDNAFDLTLLPIGTLITRFHRLIRDLSVELGKKIDFTYEGADVELDKAIIQNLSEPILHILRNAIDHGIEAPADRHRKGKKETGSLHFHAYYAGADVLIKIRDDGKGIDPQKVYKSALEKQIVLENQELTKQEKINLVFSPGFSTAQYVTDVSGRGVGMDVVKQKIQEINGEVQVNSAIDKGSEITLKIPLTLSIIDGLLVRIGEEKYFFQLISIHNIHALEHEKLMGNYNHHIVIDGVEIPFYYMRTEFGLEPSKQEKEYVVVVKYEEVLVGIAVDEVIGEKQAVLKPLGRYMRNQEFFSGASILGDGNVALIIDSNKIIKSLSSRKILNTEI